MRSLLLTLLVLLLVPAAANAGRGFVVNGMGVPPISVFDTDTNTVVQTIGTRGTHPDDVIASPDGRRVYVSQGSAVTVLDALTGTEIGELDTDDSPGALALSRDGRYLWVAQKVQAVSSVALFDTVTLALLDEVPVGLNPSGIALSPDGSRLYTANQQADSVSIVDTAARAVIGTVPVGADPQDLAVTPDGRRILTVDNGAGAVSVIDAATQTVVGTVTVGGSPNRIAIHPDGTRAYVSTFTGNGVPVIDLATLTVVRTVPFAGSTMGLTLTADGATLYVTRSGAREVALVATATDTPTGASIAVGRTPLAVAIVPPLAPGPPLPPAPPAGAAALRPAVTAISPASGPLAGGEPITIGGAHFADTLEVRFGETPAAFTVLTADQIVATAPPAVAAGTVDVTVRTDAGRSDPVAEARFTYAPAPVLLDAPSAAAPAPAHVTPVEACTVPKVAGRRLGKARRALRRHGCRAGELTGKGRWVKRQHEAAGTVLADGARVALTLGRRPN